MRSAEKIGEMLLLHMWGWSRSKARQRVRCCRVAAAAALQARGCVGSGGGRKSVAAVRVSWCRSEGAATVAKQNNHCSFTTQRIRLLPAAASRLSAAPSLCRSGAALALGKF